MKIEEKLTKMGIELPNLEDLYRANKSGAKYVSHHAIGSVLNDEQVHIQDHSEQAIATEHQRKQFSIHLPGAAHHLRSGDDGKHRVLFRHRELFPLSDGAQPG